MINKLAKILINEIKDAIGHKPSVAEFKSCMEYLQDCQLDYLAQVGLSIYDWRHDCCIKCDECGDYFLTDALYSNDGNYAFCSNKCAVNNRINKGE